MTSAKRIGILYYGDLETRRQTTRENVRLPNIFEAFEALGVEAQPVVYNDAFCDEVKQQVSGMDAVLTWVNPIEDGCDRTMLDALLRDLAADGTYVSTHPDTILKLGTKEVLVRTRELGWGCDTHLYASIDDMRRELPARLSRGEVRVLKQSRGQSGAGVWRLERDASSGSVSGGSLVRAHHAKSGCSEEVMMLDEFFDRCTPYFAAQGGRGCMIDQVYQSRLPEGMVRCYLVKGKVEGFGRQEIVALHPPAPGASPDSAPKPTKRHYHPATMPAFQRLKLLVESEWVPAAQKILHINATDLPMLWDCDFMFGPKEADGRDSYVLCEINVSCVSPFPESAAGPLAAAVMEQIA